MGGKKKYHPVASDVGIKSRHVSSLHVRTTRGKQTAHCGRSKWYQSHVRRFGCLCNGSVDVAENQTLVETASVRTEI
jgi:hypothetical protein